MASQKSKILLLVGTSLVLFLFLGITIANAQSGVTQDFTDGELVTLTGTVTSIDDRGFILATESGDFFIPIPHDSDLSLYNVEIGQETIVTGYYMTHSMMFVFSEQVFHSESINGIVVEHNSGDCGSGEMGNHMRSRRDQHP